MVKILIKVPCYQKYVIAKKNSIKYKYFSDCYVVWYLEAIFIFSFSKLDSYEDYRFDAHPVI